MFIKQKKEAIEETRKRRIKIRKENREFEKKEK